MALVLKDRVKETPTTIGTGTYTLAGAVTGFEAFSSVGDGNTTYYACTAGTDFEVGIGTYTLSGTTLSRSDANVLQSSISDNRVDWGAGTKTIFCAQPADKAVFLDASGDVTLPGGVTATGEITSLNAVSNNSNGIRTVMGNDGGSGIIGTSTNHAFKVTTNGADRMTVTASGIDVTGTVTFDGGTTSANLDFGDSVQARFGASQDLIIHHNGNHSFIREAGTGDLRIQATNLTLESGNGELFVDTTVDGAVELYHDNSKKLETASGGISVTGEVAATSLDISGDVDVDGTLEADAMTLNGTAITTTATLSTGISNNNVPKFTSGVADNDFLRVDGTAIEGRSASEVLSDIAAMPLAGGTFTGDVTLIDTDAGSSVGPVLPLRRDSASPADADQLGTIIFKGQNDAAENIEYGRITGKILDNTDGTEDGGVLISVRQAGTSVSNRITCQGFGPTAFNNKDVKLNGVDLIFEGATPNDHETTLTVTDPNQDNTITLPDATGTVALTSDVTALAIALG